MQDDRHHRWPDQTKASTSVSYYNAEHYADPTAYHALRNIERDRQEARQADGDSQKQKVCTQVVRYD